MEKTKDCLGLPKSLKSLRREIQNSESLDCWERLGIQAKM